MDYQSLHMKTVVELRKLAKDAGVKVPAGTNKTTLIQLLLESEKPAAPKPAAKPAPKQTQKPNSAPSPEAPAEGGEKRSGNARRRRHRPKAPGPDKAE